MGFNKIKPKLWMSWKIFWRSKWYASLQNTAVLWYDGNFTKFYGGFSFYTEVGILKVPGSRGVRYCIWQYQSNINKNKASNADSDSDAF